MTRSRVLLLAVALAALLAATPVAQALPGDPPVTAIGPADGATLPVDPDGIPVVYGCPTYRPFEGFFYGRSQYNVSFATSPALGADGRLDPANVVAIAGPDDVQDVDLGPDQCRGWMYDGSTQPQTTPGTYYWQAFRICTGCATGYETGPVRSFTLTLAGSEIAFELLRPPGQLYRGFPGVYRARTSGIPTGGTVRVQGKGSSGWKTLGRGTVTADQVVVPFTAVKGLTVLRLAYGSGSDQVRSAKSHVRVLEATSWPKARRWAGTWKGTTAGVERSVRFSVGGTPPKLDDGSFRLNLLCPGIPPSPTTIQAAVALVPRAKVAPDGSFVRAVAGSGQSVLVWGRLGDHKATGTVVMSQGPCAARARWKASHAPAG